MNKKIFGIFSITFLLILAGCKVPTLIKMQDAKPVPTAYNTQSKDSINSADIKWKIFFEDPYLVSLIDTALKNNYEVLSNFNVLQSAYV